MNNLSLDGVTSIVGGIITVGMVFTVLNSDNLVPAITATGQALSRALGTAMGRG